MYRVVWYPDRPENGRGQIIDTTGKPNRYGNPMLFKTIKDAENYVNKRSYSGMSCSYVIKEDIVAEEE